MSELKWNDCMVSNGRKPMLFVCGPNRKWSQFHGSPIKGVVEVKKSSFSKNGKWSNTDYLLEVCHEAIAVDVLEPRGGWGNSFADIASGFTVLGRSGIDTASMVLIAKEIAPLITIPFFRDAYKRALENERALKEGG